MYNILCNGVAGDVSQKWYIFILKQFVQINSPIMVVIDDEICVVRCLTKNMNAFNITLDLVKTHSI